MCWEGGVGGKYRTTELGRCRGAEHHHREANTCGRFSLWCDVCNSILVPVGKRKGGGSADVNGRPNGKGG